MFDPTIFENIKVVIQGAIYDLDLKGSIIVTDRSDQVDLAHMSRMFRIRFQNAEQSGYAFGELVLQANLRDLATEILEMYEEPKPGCRLEICFEQREQTEEEEIAQLHEQLIHIWGARPDVRHEICGEWHPASTNGVDTDPAKGKAPSFTKRHRITLDFNRTIDENQIEDIPEILELMLETLMILDGKVANKRV